MPITFRDFSDIVEVLVGSFVLNEDELRVTHFRNDHLKGHWDDDVATLIKSEGANVSSGDVLACKELIEQIRDMMADYAERLGELAQELEQGENDAQDQ